MIYSNLKNISRYYGISKNLDEAIKFLESFDQNEYEDGSRIDIIDDDVYAFIATNNLKNDDDIFLEGHKRYADIQIVLSNSERMYYAHIDDSNPIDEYLQENDYQKYKSDKLTCINVMKNEFIIFFPEDIHGPGYIEKNECARKLVVKVRV